MAPPLLCPGGTDFQLWQMEIFCQSMLYLDYNTCFHNKKIVWIWRADHQNLCIWTFFYLLFIQFCMAQICSGPEHFHTFKQMELLNFALGCQVHRVSIISGGEGSVLIVCLLLCLLLLSWSAQNLTDVSMKHEGGGFQINGWIPTCFFGMCWVGYHLGIGSVSWKHKSMRCQHD